MSPEDGRRERDARSVALERAYVHDVYDQISTHFSNARYKGAWPKVRQFLQNLEPGSLVADIGCGNGKYMQTNNQIFNIGVDRCANLANSARQRDNELMISDNLCLPFRESSFDACLSIAVIHHFGTTERRVSALRELARILRIGGRLMITVWAMEQRHRKFESQDVLVPWHRPEIPSSDDKGSSIDNDLNSTTTDEEDTHVHYHACHQSDDSATSTKSGTRRSTKKRSRSRRASSALEGHNNKDDGLDGDEDDEDGCYTSCGRHCELHPRRLDSEASSPKESCYSFVRRALQVASSDTPTTEQKLTNSRRGSTGRSWVHGGNWSPQMDGRHQQKRLKPPFTHSGSLDSQENLDDVPIELRHLEPDDPALLHIPPTPSQMYLVSSSPTKDAKSRSLTDLVKTNNITPIFNKISLPYETDSPSENSGDVMRSKSSSSCLSLSSRTNASSPISASGVSTESGKGLDSKSADSGLDEETIKITRKRPTLKKQKASIHETDPPIVIEISKPEHTLESPSTQRVEIEAEVIEKDYLKLPKLGIIKQSSLNDEFIYLDRVMENERLKKSIQKQSSLNDDLMYGNKSEKSESLRDRIFRSQYRHLQVLKDGFQRLRTASLDRFDFDGPETIKNNILKLIQSWQSEIVTATTDKKENSGSHNENECDEKSQDSFPQTSISKFSTECQSRSQSLCMRRRRSSSNEANSSGLDKTVSVQDPFERKSSKDDSSDSSKENSFQSDTSLDSEDSCISVIFVPKPGQSNVASFDKERNRSVSSESSEGSDKPNSPKSPKSPKSPCSGRYFSAGKYLGTKMSRSCSVTSSPSNVTESSTKISSPLSTDIHPNCPSSSDISLATSSASLYLPVPSEAIIEEDSMDHNDIKMQTAKENTLYTSSSVKSSLENSPTLILENSSLAPLQKKNSQNILPVKITPADTQTSTNLKKDVVTSICGNIITSKLANVRSEEQSTSPKLTRPCGKLHTRHSQNIPKKKTVSSSLIPPPIPPFKALNKMPAKGSRTDITLKTSFTSSIDVFSKYDHHFSKQENKFLPSKSSSVTKENLEVKSGKTKTKTVQVARKNYPRLLTFEVFNPETDDLDSDSSASSSPHSGSSVIERGWPTEKEIEELDREIKKKEEEERIKALDNVVLPINNIQEESDEFPKISLVEPVHIMATINEESQNIGNREHFLSEKAFIQRNYLHQQPSAWYKETPGSFSCLEPIPISPPFKFPQFTSPMSQRSATYGNSSLLRNSENRASVKIQSLFSTTTFRRPQSSNILYERKVPLHSTISTIPSQLDGGHFLTSSLCSDDFSSKVLKEQNQRCSSSHLRQERFSSHRTPFVKPNTKSSYSYESYYDKDSNSSVSLQPEPISYPIPLVKKQPYASNAPQKAVTQSLVSCLLPPESRYKTEAKLQRTGHLETNPKVNRDIWTADSSLLNTGIPIKSYGTLKSYQSPQKTIEPPSHADVKNDSQNEVTTCNLDDARSLVKQHVNEFTNSDIFRDSSKNLLADSVHIDSSYATPLDKKSFYSKRLQESKHGTFEFPSFLQSFLNSASTDSTDSSHKKPQGPSSKMYLKNTQLICQENESSENNINEVAERKNKSRSGEKEKLNRSESCLPLLYCDETISDHSAPDEDLKKQQQLLFLPEMRKRSNSSVSATSTSTSSTTASKRTECKHCKLEEEKRRKKLLQSDLKKSDSRLLKTKRELLRPQGSLDSAQEKPASGKSTWFELSRSGSLDLEAASKLHGGISLDSSMSTSQDSLQSDIGGAPTLHRYYHVFKEGELDQLIEKYVHNLHIIASYYDHSNWCIVAEKVRVWTI